MGSPLNRTRIQRPIAILLLALVLVGLIAGAVRAVNSTARAQTVTIERTTTQPRTARR